MARFLSFIWGVAATALLVVPSPARATPSPVRPPTAPITPAAMIKALSEALAAGETSYSPPAGTYNFSTLPVPSFSLSNVDYGFVFDLTNSLFLFPPGEGITFSNLSQGFTLKGLTIDYDPMYFTQGTVTHITPKKQGESTITYTLVLDSGYPELDDPIFTTQDSKTIFWHADTREMYHEQVATTTVLHPDPVRVSPGVWNITTSLPGPLLPWTPDVGCLSTISPVLQDAIQCFNCSAVSFIDVTLWAASGMGYLEAGGGGYGGGNILLRWNAIRAPGTDRLLCTTLDGVHSTSQAVGLQLIDSTVSYAADDLFAVHCELGIVFGVVPSSSTTPTISSLYIIDTGGSLARNIAVSPPGSAFQFFALNTTMESFGTFTVANISVVMNQTLQEQANNASAEILAKKHIVMRPLKGLCLLVQVDFTTPLPSTVTDQFSSMVQTDAQCGKGTKILNSVFHDTTGGIRLKGVDVLLHNSTLSRGYGVNMLPEPFWTQSVSSNISIINNTFITTGNAPNAATTIEYNNDTCPGLVLINNTFLP